MSKPSKILTGSKERIEVQNNFSIDLSAKNPNKKAETALRQPQEILEDIKALDKESVEIMKIVERLINN